MAKTVTALQVQKRNPNRVNVYLDGEYAFGLSRIVAAWLQVGQQLSDEDIERYQQREVKEAASQTAQRLLSYRPRSADEMRQRLEKKGFSASVIAETLARLQETGQLNDRQFAVDWVENQSTFRPRGRRLLNYELRRKGLGEDAIQQALQTAGAEEDLAYKAAARKAQILGSLDRQEFRRKLIEFLARRGFNYSTAAAAAARLWNEQHNSAADPDEISE